MKQPTTPQAFDAALTAFDTAKDNLLITSNRLLEQLTNTPASAMTLDEKAQAYLDFYMKLEPTLKDNDASLQACNVVSELLDKIAYDFGEYVLSNPEAVWIHWQKQTS